MVADEPDLQQELALHVSTHMTQYDPARGSRSTFVDKILDTKIANLLEYHLAVKRGSGKHPQPLEDSLAQTLKDSSTNGSAIDLKFDMQNAMETLPPGLRETAVLLSTYPTSEVARMLRLTRGQMRHRLAAIRRELEGAGISMQQPTRRRSR